MRTTGRGHHEGARTVRTSPQMPGACIHINAPQPKLDNKMAAKKIDRKMCIEYTLTIEPEGRNEYFNNASPPNLGGLIGV